MIDVAIMIYQQRHHARFPIISGPGNHREAANQATVDNVVVFASGSRRALSGEDLEVVTGIRRLRVFDFSTARDSVLRLDWPPSTARPSYPVRFGAFARTAALPCHRAAARRIVAALPHKPAR